MMSASPIPPVANGVRGGQPHRGRSHRRNTGLSIPPTHQKSSSYSGFLTPTPPTPRSPYAPSQYTTDNNIPPVSHTRHYSELPSFSPSLSTGLPGSDSPQNGHATHLPVENISPGAPGRVANGYQYFKGDISEPLVARLVDSPSYYEPWVTL